MLIAKNDIPTASGTSKRPGCEECKRLKEIQAENKQLQWECDTVIQIMDFLLSTIELWAKQNGSIPLGSRSKEDIEKEFADGKDKIRTLFNNLIETGEPAFLDRLFRVLNFPKDFQHFL